MHAVGAHAVGTIERQSALIELTKASVLIVLIVPLIAPKVLIAFFLLIFIFNILVSYVQKKWTYDVLNKC